MANNDASYDVANSPIEDEPPISVPDSGETGEGGKVKMIVQLVKKCLGVKDIAAMFVSFNSNEIKFSLSTQTGVCPYPLLSWNQYPTSSIGTIWTDQIYSLR